jgi:uncharacterized membrane protein YhaH (DUF805 family)
MNIGLGPRRLGDNKASSIWILLCLVCALVIGASVGGAVGGLISAGKENQVAKATQSSTMR